MIYFSKESMYGEEEKDILEFVSEQIAMAIKRVRAEEELKKYQTSLEERIKRRTARLIAAYKISEAAHTVRNLKDIYPKIHEIVDSLMHAKNFYITLYDDVAGRINLAYFKDEKYKGFPVDRILKKGLTGYVIRTGKSLLASQEVFDKLEKEGKVERIGSQPIDWLGVPLKVDKKTVGVLAVKTYNPEMRYREADKEVLEFVSEQIAMAIERVQSQEELEKHRNRLEELVKERTAQLNAAYKISEAAHTVRNIESLYPELHKIIGELMNTENFHISLYNSSANTLCFPYFVNNKGEEPPKSIPAEKDFSGYVLQTQKPLFGSPEVVKKLIEDGKIIPVSKTPVTFWLGVPLKTQEKMIGVLAVYDHDGKVIYDRDDLEILTFVSEQIAMAIERVRSQEELEKYRSRLEELVKERTAQLNAAYKISEAAHTVRNIESLYPELHKIIGELMNTENFHISLYNSSANTLCFPYFVNNKGEEPPKSIPAEKDFSGYVLQTQKPLFGSPEVVKKLIEDGKIIPISKTPVSFWLGVPLRTHEKMIGVLAVYDHDEKVIYGKDDLEILTFVSEQIAMAIERVRSQEELEKYRSRLEELVEERTERLEKLDRLNRRKEVLIQLSQTLTSAIQLNEDEICQLIYDNASELMDTDNMYIALYDNQTDIVRFGLAYKGGRSINVSRGEEEDGYQPRSGGQGKTEAIIHSKEPIFHPTKAEAEAWYDEPGRLAYDRSILPSWVGVPMIAGDKLLGVIASYHPEKEHVYSESDVEILQAMANLAAIALDNAGLVNRLKQAQGEIADRERDLVMSGLAMDFAHRMNNIAGIIPPWISLIKRRLTPETDPKVIQYLDKIVRDTSHILKEANELRNPVAKSELTDMEEVTGSVLAQVEMMTPPDILFNFEPDTDLFRVHGMKEHLAVAVHSVITNSVKSISGQGEITIHLRNLIKRAEKYIEINISDTGCGIPQDKIDSVFEYGTSLWSDKRGTGYGLWRARNIIQSMNGSIKITHSEVAKGTTFTIILPAVETEKT